MIIFKTLLSDKQVEEYKRPEGTKDPKCGRGMNCAFCTLKMLGVYNPDLEEKSKTCGPRADAGNIIKEEEYIPAIKGIIADITTEHHEFTFKSEPGKPSETLQTIAQYLHAGEACFFTYGRLNGGAHAVVLRKNQDGVLELIDPQRGLDDIGKQHGFTPERAAELGIEATPEYYRVQNVRGGEIEQVMFEQSVLFGYWKSLEELMNDLPHFVVGSLLVDSVVGLTMLVEDKAPPREPTVVVPKRPREYESKISLNTNIVSVPPEKRLKVDVSSPQMMEVEDIAAPSSPIEIDEGGGRTSPVVQKTVDIAIRRRVGGSYRKTIDVQLMQVDDSPMPAEITQNQS